MGIPQISDLVNRIPVPAWLQAVRNALGFYGLGVILLFALALIVYLAPGGFTPSQRIYILVGIGALATLIYVLATVLQALPGDRSYSPAERSLSAGRIYGTKGHPQPRRRALNSPPTVPPTPDLIEGEGDRPSLPEGPE